MSARAIGILVCIAVFNQPGLRAQQNAPASSTPAPTSSTPAQTAESPAIDATKLGISFDRVRIQLEHPATPTGGGGLKIRETVEVVGKAPPLTLWDPKTTKAELTSEAVPWGAPTQKDIMRLIVPKEFQNYPFDLNALVQWLMGHLNKNESADGTSQKETARSVVY